MWDIKDRRPLREYVYAKVPEHPKSTERGWVLEHRVVAENHLGRVLKDNEVIHHKNGDKSDNQIDNLEVMTNKEHSKLHARNRTTTMVKLKCPECGNIFHRKKKQTFLTNNRGSYTACSRSCSGKLSHKDSSEINYFDNVIEVYESNLS